MIKYWPAFDFWGGSCVCGLVCINLFYFHQLHVCMSFAFYNARITSWILHWLIELCSKIHYLHFFSLTLYLFSSGCGVLIMFDVTHCHCMVIFSVCWAELFFLLYNNLLQSRRSFLHSIGCWIPFPYFITTFIALNIPFL